MQFAFMMSPAELAETAFDLMIRFKKTERTLRPGGLLAKETP